MSSLTHTHTLKKKKIIQSISGVNLIYAFRIDLLQSDAIAGNPRSDHRAMHAISLKSIAKIATELMPHKSNS